MAKKAISETHRVAIAYLYKLGVHTQFIRQAFGCSQSSVNRFKKKGHDPSMEELPQRPGYDTPQMFTSVWRLYCDLYAEWLLVLGDPRASPQEIPLATRFGLTVEHLDTLRKGCEEQLELTSVVARYESELWFLLRWPTFLIESRKATFTTVQAVEDAFIPFIPT